MTPNSLETVPLEALCAVVGGARACAFTEADRKVAIQARVAAGESKRDAEFHTPTVRQAQNRCFLNLNPWDTSKDKHVPAEKALRPRRR